MRIAQIRWISKLRDYLDLDQKSELANHFKPVSIKSMSKNISDYFAQIFAVLGLIATLFFGYSAYTLEDDHSLIAFALLSGAIMISLAAYSYIIHRQERKLRELYAQNRILKARYGISAASDRAHSQAYVVIAYLLTYVSQYQVGIATHIDDEGNINETELDNFCEYWETRISTSLCNNASRLFEQFTGYKCSVCIKQIQEIRANKDVIKTRYEHNGPGNLLVSTLVRDTLSAKDRKGKSVDEPHNLIANQAFKDILSDSKPNTYFVSDDLGALERYNNPNRFWQNFYNSTLVVPIYIPAAVSKSEINASEMRIIGFLCIDSKKASFSSDICRNLAENFAMIASFLMDEVEYDWEMETSDG